MIRNNQKSIDLKSVYFSELLEELKQSLRFSERDSAEFDKYWRMMINISADPALPSFNHNLLIWCENTYVAKYVFDKMRIFLSLCKTNAGWKYILIDSKENLGEFKGKFNVSSKKQDFVVLVRKDAFENPRTEFGDELYYRGLPIHLSVNTTESQVVAERIIDKLHAIKPVKLNTEFEEAFTAYIETVYPKADLRRDNMAGDDQPFIDDAVQRVLREYTGQHMLGEEAGAECVPYYQKNTVKPVTEEKVSIDIPKETETFADLKEAETPADLEKVVSEQKKIELQVEAEAILKTEITPELQIIDPIADISEEELSSCEIKNVLLLNLSRIFNNQTLSWNDNKYRNEEAYVGGYYTMEPVPKVLIKQGKTPLLIIIMASEEAVQPVEFITEKEKKVRGKYSAGTVDFFKRQVSAYKQDCKVYYKVICTGDSKQAPETLMKSLMQAASQVVDTIRSLKDITLYLDMHGGRREDQLIVDAIVNMLNMDNIAIQDAFSIAGAGLPIKSVKKHLGIFNFVSGMNEFINYGYGQTLKNYVESAPMSGNQVWRKNLTNNIQQVSEALALCKINTLESSLTDLEKTIEAEHDKNDLLEIFINNIKQDYGKMLKEDQRNLYDMIYWAYKKQFYQQCLAMIEAKTAEFVFDNLFESKPEKIKVQQKLFNEYVDIPYGDFRKNVKRELYEDEKNYLLKKMFYSRQKRAKEAPVEFDNCLVQFYYSQKDNNKKDMYQEYHIFFQRKGSFDLSVFDSFGQVWWELKEIRNKIFHVTDADSIKKEDVEEKIEMYLKGFKILMNTDTPSQYSATLMQSKSGKWWVKVEGAPFERRSNLPYDGRVIECPEGKKNGDSVQVVYRGKENQDHVFEIIA